jgi:hypothetical protein
MKSVALAVRVAGAAMLAIAAIQLILVGKAHHDRSGNAPLAPTFTALETDLMERAGRALKVGAAGGVLLALSHFL